ncbi:hypothetical protein D3C81_1780570 [compost metagenome]
MAVVAPLAAGGVTGQVDPRHGTDQLIDITSGRASFDFFGSDGGNAGRLKVLFGGGDDDDIFRGGFFFAFLSQRGAV